MPNPTNVKTIGFLGNMNNYPFMLAKHLRERGYEIKFILIEKETLCRPEYRYNDVTLPYQNWIQDFSPLCVEFFSEDEKSQKFEKIISILNSCDLVFLNGYAIRYSHLLKPQYICILTGSDLTVLADYKYVNKLYNEKIKNTYENKKTKKHLIALKLIDNKNMFYFFYFLITKFKIKYNNESQWFLPKNIVSTFYHFLRYKIELTKFINLQRSSIKNCIGFIHAPKNLIQDSDTLIKEIRVDEEKRIVGLMTDFTISDYVAPKTKNVVRIFNVARFNWVKTKDIIHFSQLDFKGNDIMIKGLALFYQKYSMPMELVFVNKGEDVKESKQLAIDLGISHLITWLEVLTQKEVYEEYCKADIVFDQLGESIVSMGGLDAMSIGRPLIANARVKIFDDLLKQKTEICNATSAEDVFTWLEKLILDKEYCIKKGKASREFVLRHFSGDAVVNRVEEKINKYLIKSK